MKRTFKEEGDVKKAIKEILKRFAPLKYDMPGATMYGASGRHDFIMCQHGFFWTIEAKFGKNPPTDLQIDYANDIQDTGGCSLCINEKNLDQVEFYAGYIARHGRAPDKGHDFEQWRKE